VLGPVRWPILAGIVALALAIVYRYAPDRARNGSAGDRLRQQCYGSWAYTTYVSKVGSYDKTYGSLGAVIILLLWFYVSAYVILAGAELNAEIERQTTRAGAPCSVDPQRQ
jgi:membrane protein